jgi:ABC-type microcin C transport system duplicated ATPase subunit YejF
LPVERGWVRFQGEALPFSQRVLTRDRRIQAVFQDPFASMNPRLSVAEILLEGLQAARDRRSSSECRARILEVLGAMGLDASVLGAYPHEFSGGQRQRLCLARALVLRPEVLVLDEPTSALDVTIQAKVLELLESLKTRFQLSYLLITHDLGVVSRLADRVLVMDEGRAVETGPVARVLTHPRSAAAQALMAALPAIRR